MFYLKQAKRFASVILNYRTAALAYCLTIIGKIPGFNYTYSKYSEPDYESMQGYAHGIRLLELWLFNWKIISLLLRDKEEVSAFHFFLHRSVRDFFRLVKTIEESLGTSLPVDTNQKVFEPGCGAGRYLGAYLDLYGGKGIGVDGYSAAIKVANTSNTMNNMAFYEKDLAEPATLDLILSEGVDISFTSSFLVHLTENRVRLIEQLKKYSKIVFGVEKLNAQLKIELLDSGFTVNEYDDIMVFFWVSKNQNLINV